MARVGIVCDSTCDIEPAELVDLGVEMVPLKVLFGDESFLDWVELRPDRFYSMLASSPELPKTSQPSPADFSAAYARLAESGCDSIVSIHLSSALSGTHQSATIAAADASVPVHVVDSAKVTQALGLVVREAVAARDAGLDGEGVAARAREVAAGMRLYFVLDTLEYLVKGGRAGKAAGLAASLLSIKPVLLMNAEGTIEPFMKVKGRTKALQALANHVAEDAKANGHMRVGLFHACTADEGGDLRALIEATGADVEFVATGVVGSVIGTYAGPGAVGCGYYPAS